jgi:uncharacterized protein (UPF0276 family)
VQPLGIGLPYLSSLPREIYRQGLLDFAEITPEGLARQRRDADGQAIELLPDQLKRAREACADLPIAVHGVELSIGSAHGWNEAYIKMLDAFQSSWPFEWHSEHLGFQTFAGTDGTTLEVGVPLPLPATTETVNLVAERARFMLDRYAVPFLLENPAYYITGMPSDAEVGDDPELMRAITESSGCFELLDLHNVHCNAINHKVAPHEIIDRMPLERVLEIHVAGGSWHEGFYMDAHDGIVPTEVWELLEYTLSRTPNLVGIVFEMLEDHVNRVGPRIIEQQINRARSFWTRRPVAGGTHEVA